MVIKSSFVVLLIVSFVVVIMGLAIVSAWTPVAVVEDPLVRMPGTQPGQVTLEGPGRCLNCHADYNHAVEPGFNWKGSMMAQASRDFLFWSCMTVAAQDAIWAVGTPNATDICERCHFPIGWLEGRSDPSNASLMVGDDYDGVNCDFCHNLYDPFFEDTFAGVREGDDWLNYWDETNASATRSDAAAQETVDEDRLLAAGIVLFSGDPFYDGSNQPVYSQSPYSTYLVNGGGQYFVSANGQKRSSYADPAARHQVLYSRYHKSKYICSTCHDISNPVLANLGLSGLEDQSGGVDLITEQYPSWRYFHVERTFSEFMLSDYGQQGGAAGIGPFAPQEFETSRPDNDIATCQDCHMRDVVGVGCDMNNAPVRPGESVEHPNSGVPLHDMTGGNAWVSYVLASAMPGADNYDQTNYDLLNQGPGVLTLDMTAGQSADPTAILAGVERSKQQLLLAAAINGLSYDPDTGALSFQVQNQTGHKLISGFPEGRRMFVNVKAYSNGSLIYEANPYDDAAGTLKGLNESGYHYDYYDPDGILPMPEGLSGWEEYIDELVYESHTSSFLTAEDETFHFALATDRYKDNRIPPKGFRLGDPQDEDLDDAHGRLSQPRWGGLDAPEMYTEVEYAGGYDQVDLAIAAGADYVEVNLLYQTTSREYIEFLRNEINAIEGLTTLDAEAYIIQSDAFFAQLKAWGDVIWQLWTHNMNVAGAAPFLMTQGTYAGEGCMAPVPELLSAEGGQKQVTLTWSDEHTGDPKVVGYGVYYDQGGKAQLVVTTTLTTTSTDTELTNGQEYCYKVSSKYLDCESGYSNIVCATTHAGTPTPTPTDTLTPTPTDTLTPTPTDTLTPTPTDTLTPTPTDTLTPTPTDTLTPTPTDTLTPTPTDTLTPTPTDTLTPTPTDSLTPTPTVTLTPGPNQPPTNGTIDPSIGSGPVGATTHFATTWSDADGWQDLKQCYFHIGSSPSLAGNVTLMYNARKDKLWIRSDDGSTWLGGYATGSANTLENSQAQVHCVQTTVQGLGNTVEVSWAISFKATFTGEKKTGLKCQDAQGAAAKGQWKGTWTIYLQAIPRGEYLAW
jgi:hypothetical protein